LSRSRCLPYTAEPGEAKSATNFFNLPGHQTLGGAFGHGHYSNFDQDLIAFIPRSGVKPVQSENSWALYYNFDQYLWTLPRDPTRGIGIFGRLGFADETTSHVAQFYSFGVGGKGACAERPDDRFGLGYYYMKTSRDLPAFLHLGDEQGFEAFYNFAITLPSC
jgi:porin